MITITGTISDGVNSAPFSWSGTLAPPTTPLPIPAGSILPPGMVDFSAGWTPRDCSLGTGMVFPDGKPSKRVTEDTAQNVSHFLMHEHLPVTPGKKYTIGMFAHSPDTNRLTKLECYDGGYTKNVIIFTDVRQGKIFYNSPPNSSDSMQMLAARIKPFGNVWQIEADILTTATSINFFVGLATNGGVGVYNGDGVSAMDYNGFYIVGA